MHLGSRDMTIFGERASKKSQNLKMPITFDTVAQIHGGLNLAIVFGNNVIMTSFIIVGLSNQHIL